MPVGPINMNRIIDRQSVHFKVPSSFTVKMSKSMLHSPNLGPFTAMHLAEHGKRNDFRGPGEETFLRGGTPKLH